MEKLPRSYDGTQYGIELMNTAVQKMSDGGPTHDQLQEVVYGWLNGTTLFFMSEFENLTYADFVEHIGCDAQEYLFKTLGSKRGYVWKATDKQYAWFAAFFRENDEGEWTIHSTGSAQISVPDAYIDQFKK